MLLWPHATVLRPPCFFLQLQKHWWDGHDAPNMLCIFGWDAIRYCGLLPERFKKPWHAHTHIFKQILEHIEISKTIQHTVNTIIIHYRHENLYVCQFMWRINVLLGTSLAAPLRLLGEFDFLRQTIFLAWAHGQEWCIEATKHEHGKLEQNSPLLLPCQGLILLASCWTLIGLRSLFTTFVKHGGAPGALRVPPVVASPVQPRHLGGAQPGSGERWWGPWWVPWLMMVRWWWVIFFGGWLMVG